MVRQDVETEHAAENWVVRQFELVTAGSPFDEAQHFLPIKTNQVLFDRPRDLFAEKQTRFKSLPQDFGLLAGIL